MAAKFGTLDAVVAHMRAEMAAGKPISPNNFEYDNEAIFGATQHHHTITR